jgi:hypothetical protein
MSSFWLAVERIASSLQGEIISTSIDASFELRIPKVYFAQSNTMVTASFVDFFARIVFSFEGV